LKKFNFEENANGLAELDRLYTETKKRWESAQERIRTQEKEGKSDCRSKCIRYLPTK